MTASNDLVLDCDPAIETSQIIADEFYWVVDKRSVTNTTSVAYVSVVSASLSDEAKNIVSKLTGFKNLENNWDSYGAVAPARETVDSAIAFVKRADGNLLPFYFTAPGPDGDLVIEFRRGNREASVYFSAEGPDELLLSENNQIILEGTLEDNYKNLLQFING